MSKKSFLVITPQTILQENKASTHFLIEELALREDVRKVDVFTVNLSLIKLIKDKNYSHISLKTILNGFQKGKIYNRFVVFPIHFVNLQNKVLNKIIYFLNLFFTFFYFLFSKRKKYTHIIFVAGTPLFTYQIMKFQKYFGKDTKIIYRVVDDLETVNLNSAILKLENILDKNIFIHTVNNDLTLKYKNMGYNNIFTQNHAVDIRSIDAENINPYKKDTINLIFVGMSMLDFKFLEIATLQFKEYNFWVIGPFEDKIQRKNIIFLGKLPFNETLKYIKFADIGLQTLTYAKNIGSLQKTLKFQQYKYVRLPIIMPKYIALDNLSYGEFSYTIDKKSIQKSIKDALITKRENIDTSFIVGWEEYTQRFVEKV